MKIFDSKNQCLSTGLRYHRKKKTKVNSKEYQQSHRMMGTKSYIGITSHYKIYIFYFFFCFVLFCFLFFVFCLFVCFCFVLFCFVLFCFVLFCLFVCLFVLLKDTLDEGFLGNLDFWMHSIYTFTSASQEMSALDQQNQLSPPILIVGTHKHSLAETAAEQDEKVQMF